MYIYTGNPATTSRCSGGIKEKTKKNIHNSSSSFKIYLAAAAAAAAHARSLSTAACCVARCWLSLQQQRRRKEGRRSASWICMPDNCGVRGGKTYHTLNSIDLASSHSTININMVFSLCVFAASIMQQSYLE